MITKQTIAIILETARIEEVIGDFVKLKKSGQNYKGLSPFTDERNPSFYVSPAKGIYKCFSSGKGGNIVNFIMEHEHFTYPEALRFLAKRYNIPITEEEVTPEETQAENEKETLFQVAAYAQKYFSEQLFESEEGKALGLEYFKAREFLPDTIRKFQLGYNPGWDAFTRHALAEGYKPEYLEKTGLTINKDGKNYDRFRSRVIFPVHNISGRILGFGGRTLSKDENIPKYVNSPESDIYNKSQILYGLYFAKSTIIRQDNCYLVEGYTDVISLHQAGIENVVASSGTSLTDEQIRLIKRYTLNVTILYDGDPAGIKASFRGIDMILEEGMNVRIVLFPDNEDPDSYARKHRRAELEELITKGAVDFIRFKTNLLLNEAKGDPIKRAGLIKEIVGSISLIPDSIYRTVYIRECSTLMEISEQTLMNELNKIMRQRFRQKAQQVAAEQEVEVLDYPAPKQAEIDHAGSEFQERYLIYLLLRFGYNELIFNEITAENANKREENILVQKFIVEEIDKDEINLRNKVYQSIYKEFSDAIHQGKPILDDELIDHQNAELSNAVVNILFDRNYELHNWRRRRITVPTVTDNLKIDVIHTILNLKEKEVKRILDEIQKEIKIATNYEDQVILQSKYIKYKDISRKINSQIGGGVIYR